MAGAIAGRLLGRRRPARGRVPEPVSDARADELRRKLEEVRDLDAERDEFESAETPVDAVEPVAELDARRQAVHDRGRGLADEMRGSS